MIILKNDSPECIYSTYNNYTSCLDTSPNEQEVIDPAFIKAIYPPYDPNNVTDTDRELEALSGNVNSYLFQVI